MIPNPTRAYAILVVLAAAVGAVGTHFVARARQSAPVSYSGISIESSKQVFATMCALDAAGFEVDETALADMPRRLALEDELSKMRGPAAMSLRKFYADHVLADPGETLSRFMAFALVAGPPPEFRIGLNPDLISPDVLSLDGFQEILAAFYQEANLDAQWQKVQPEYERSAEMYESPVSRIVTVSNAYLREVLKSSDGRSFTLYVEPLMGSRTVFRNSGDQYGIVVGGGRELPLNEIQHAYLHFLLDPLTLRYRPLIENKDALLGIAARAPQLPVEYHDDIVALMDECLIKAVELRLRRLSQEQMETALSQDDRSGYILVRPLVQQLEKFEKAEPAMSYYFPDLITGIDTQAEQKRLQGMAFADSETAAAPVGGAAAGGQPPSDTDRLLDEGDREIARQDATAAAAKFEKVLAGDPHQPRAIYGLAIASVFSGQGDRAKELFEQLLSAQQAALEPVDPTLLAWSHVYLARMHDLAGERSLAVQDYRAALGVSGASEAARSAAQRGVDVPYKPPPGSGADTRQEP